MGLIIKDRIGANIPGTLTKATKYDIITAFVGDKPVKAGQIVAYDDIYDNAVGKATISKVSATTRYVGVVTHQNIKVESFFDSKKEQIFQPGETVGICVKGKILAIGEKDFGTTYNKTYVEADSGELKKTNTSNIDLTGKIQITGFIEKNAKLDKSLIEVEIL